MANKINFKQAIALMNSANPRVVSLPKLSIATFVGSTDIELVVDLVRGSTPNTENLIRISVSINYKTVEGESSDILLYNSTESQHHDLIVAANNLTERYKDVYARAKEELKEAQQEVVEQMLIDLDIDNLSEY